jgi:hypothetical protein
VLRNPAKLDGLREVNMAMKDHGRQYDLIVFGASGKLCRSGVSQVKLLLNNMVQATPVN